MTMFKKATKTQSKLRMALYGVSGSGKTYSALAIAAGLGGKVAVIDTERGSASKYAGKFQFDVLDMQPPYSPAAYVAAIKAAEAEGYDVLIVDSLTHAWAGSGGALEMVDNAAKRSTSGNSYVAWRDVTPEHNKLIDALIQSRCHVIATMRSKTEYLLEKNAKGQTVPRKVSMAPVQRDGMEYEFDVVAEMDAENNLIVQKSRCETLTGQVISKPNGQVSTMLKAWLTDGTTQPEQSTTGPTWPQPEQPVVTAPPAPTTSGNGHHEPAPQPAVTHPVTMTEDVDLKAVAKHIENAKRALASGSYPAPKSASATYGLLKGIAKAKGFTADELTPFSPGEDPIVSALMHSIKALGEAILAKGAPATETPKLDANGEPYMFA